MVDDKKTLTPEETRVWLRRYGWTDRNGNAYPPDESGARRCVRDCANHAHRICARGAGHEGECACVECDR